MNEVLYALENKGYSIDLFFRNYCTLIKRLLFENKREI